MNFIASASLGRWRLGLRQVMEHHGDLLAGLRLWKLSSDGVIEEDVVA
jgi:hypothetical protein